MKRITAVLLCGVMVFSLTACGSSKEKNGAEGGLDTGNVKFDCSVEVSEEFDPENFYLPQVMGMQYIDGDAACKTYVEGQEIREEYHYPSEKENVPDDDVYILTDGTQVSVSGTGGFNYATEESSYYHRVMRKNETGASKAEFAFGKGEDCVANAKEKLAALAFPTDEYRFSWFSLSGEEHQKLEQEGLEAGSIGEEDVQPDWTDKDEYEIYAWQTYGGLQVLPEIMTTTNKRAFESYQRAPVSAAYTKNGCVCLAAGVPYCFEKTDKKAVFLPFGEIAAAVEKRYENLLTDSPVTVTRAKLVLRIYREEKQNMLAAAPVWYFETSGQEENPEVLLFDAMSGKEIYLQN